MPSIDEVLESMDDKERKRFLFGEDVTITRVPTPSIGLTRALGGGWALGRQATVWGTKSAGKSTLMMEQVALCQSLGYSCAYIDTEEAFDKSWASRLGVDNKQLIYRNSKSMNHVADDSAALLRAGVDVLIIDSITPLVPAAYLEKDGETLKAMSDMGALGSVARDTSKLLSNMNYENNNTLVILISQHRMKSSGMYWGMGATNGNAVEFYSQQMVKLFSSEGGTNTIEGQVTYGDLVVKKPIGRKVNYTVQYNKLGPQSYTGQYNLYYEGDFVGIDKAGEILDIAVEAGVINRAGSWYALGDNRLGQGADNVAERLRKDEELLREVKEKIGYSE